MARKMKDSGIEWIGEIPEGWEVVQLKRFAEVHNGREIDVEVDSTDSSAVGVYGSGGVFKYTNRAQYSGKAVLFGRKGTLGKPLYVEGQLWAVDTMYFLTYSNRLLEKFSYYQFLAFNWAPYITHTAIPSVVASEIVACYFPIPPLEEQAKIADYLDNGCASLDTILDKTRSSIEEYKKLKQAVITQAVTKGVRGKREMKDSGNPWFGQIPTDWKLSRVGLHFSIILGKMLCNAPLNDTYTLEPYYCAADVHFDGVADGERKKMWFSPIEKDLYRVSVGDLLVVEGGAGAGGSAIVENQDSYTYIQNSIMIVRSKGNTDNRYLRYLLEFLVKQGYIDVVCNKATIPHFTKDKLSCVPFCLCGEQEEIADYLDAKCADIDKLIAKKEQLVKELENYKKSLIFEYVTGKKELRR